MRKVSLALSLLALAVPAVALSACGSSDDSSSSSDNATTTSQPATDATTSPSSATGGAAAGGGETLKLAADPSGALKFDTDALSAKAGKVTIVMDNPSPVQHAIAVEGNGVDQDGRVVEQGGVSKVSFDDLKPGTYTFYCPVPGHEDGGMKGTLTVK